MLYTIAKEKWETIVTISKRITEGHAEVSKAWEALADEYKFVSQSVEVVDEEKGVIEAEPRPSAEYVKAKQILMLADVVAKLPEEDRKELFELAAHQPSLSLPERVALIQEGHSARDAHMAEAVPVLDEGVPAGVATMDAEA